MCVMLGYCCPAALLCASSPSIRRRRTINLVSTLRRPRHINRYLDHRFCYPAPSRSQKHEQFSNSFVAWESSPIHAQHATSPIRANQSPATRTLQILQSLTLGADLHVKTKYLTMFLFAQAFCLITRLNSNKNIWNAHSATLEQNVICIQQLLPRKVFLLLHELFW